MSEELHEIKGRLNVRETRIRELIDGLIKMDERFRGYLLPPLPHEILSFIHTLSDFLREHRSWLDDMDVYRKAIERLLQK